MLVIKALQFAAQKHKGQERKGSGLPYVTHPVIAAYLLAKYKKSKRFDELVAAAILHDTLEDTDTNFIELASEFTPLIASLVLELTSDEEQIKLVGKNEYLKKKMLGMSSYGLLLKLVDRLSNIMDNPKDNYKTDTINMVRFLEENARLSNTHKAIIADIKSHLRVELPA